MKIPCKLQKFKDGKYTSQADIGIYGFNTDIASTLTSHYYKGVNANGDNIVLEIVGGGCSEMNEEMTPECLGGFGNKCNNDTQYHQQNRVYSGDKCAISVCTAFNPYYLIQKYNIRIRKLTPKECFRLQGVADDEADRMMSVNSNSQCYKQAGNSITVDVMTAMFKRLV